MGTFALGVSNTFDYKRYVIWRSAKWLAFLGMAALLSVSLADEGVEHEDHKHEETRVAEDQREVKIFLGKLFEKYGENGVMTFEGFEHLLQSLGIGNVKISDHDIDDHRDNGKFVDFHSSHNHSVEVVPHGNHSHSADDTDDVLGVADHDGHHEHEHKKRGTQTNHADPGNSYHGNEDDDHHSDSHLIQNGTASDANAEPGHHANHHGNHSEHHLNGLNLGHNSHGRRTRNKNKKKNKNEAAQSDTPGQEGFRVKREAQPKAVGDRKKREIAEERSHTHEDHHHEPPEDEKVSNAEDVYGDPLEKPPCMTASEILETYHVTYKDGISEHLFLDLCPAIIYQIDKHMCVHGHHDDHDHDHVHVSNRSIAASYSMLQVAPEVWGYAVASVTVISLVGLLSVAMVPLLEKAFYNHLIQFLVALAIGSLTGDALLHLIPHALGGGHEDGEGHDHGAEGGEAEAPDRDPIWKGMVVLAGIYFFFMAERGMGMYNQWKANHRKEPQGVKLRTRTPTRQPRRQSWRFSAIGQKLSQYDTLAFSSEDVGIISKTETKILEDTFELKECEDVATDQGQGHSHGGEGHSHGGHGHSHGVPGEMPTSVAAIAWMVIMGDGLHNFSDGLAIGAGFANSLTGGLSTSVAVFCHELPHELGDFAVLLRTGMSVKQALFYNIVSSVLCFIGMAIGVAVGNIGTASLWIFAMTAGTFIYISLVDMLPELSADSEPQGPGKLCILLLQAMGITVGISIMLVIALYEHKIKVNVGGDT